MKKRGSHVGMILSFVIFIIFLVFLYSIVEPTIKTQKDKQSLLDYLEIELRERFSENLTSVSVGINRTYTTINCIKLEDFMNEVKISSQIIIKDEFENTLSAKLSGDDLQIIREDLEAVFFKIYNSEEFEEIEVETISPCRSLESGKTWRGYTVGSVKENEYIFETKILKLIDEYEAGYQGLKNDLNIPTGTEFGFSFTYSNVTKIGTEEKNISTSVYADETPIQYIDKEADLLSGFINVRVW